MKPKWRAFAVALTACAALAMAACGSSDEGSGSGANAAEGGTSAGEPVKVAVVLYGPPDDGGWNSIWQQSVDKLEQAVPEAEVTVVPNINAGAAAQRTVDTLARQGNKVIVLTGGYSDSDLRKATQAYPDVAFVNLYGSKVEENLGRFDAAVEEGRYLDGIIAGMLTKSNVLGEVGGYPIPVEARTLNAFALGVRSVNPEAKVKILWVNSFYDPTKERQAAQALVGEGADVLVMDSNTPAVAAVARATDSFLVGYGVSREKDAPDQWLSTFTYDWSPYLIEWTKAVQDGTWKSGLFYEGLKTGRDRALRRGQSRSRRRSQAKVDEARKQIESGELKIFSGPIVDNAGETVVPEGEALDTPEELNACCTWLVDNVEGKLG